MINGMLNVVHNTAMFIGGIVAITAMVLGGIMFVYYLYDWINSLRK